jgi:NAD(P)H-dependent FMN reductase
MSTPKILAFAGSARTDSFNKRLVKIAAEGAKAAGAEVTYVDLRDIPMPLYDQDLEAKEGIPPNARAFKALMKSHDALLIASPEHNSSVSALMKNVIDWASRAEGDEKPLACYAGKVAAIMSASPGALGGLRGLVHLRAILGNINVLVLPGQVAVSQAHEAFTPDGSLKDEKKQQAVHNLGKTLADTTSRLRANS